MTGLADFAAELEEELEEVNADNVILANQRDELLDALEALLEYVDWENDDLGLLSKLKDEARAAIAKVRP